MHKHKIPPEIERRIAIVEERLSALEGRKIRFDRRERPQVPSVPPPPPEPSVKKEWMWW